MDRSVLSRQAAHVDKFFVLIRAEPCCVNFVICSVSLDIPQKLIELITKLFSFSSSLRKAKE